MLPVWLAGKRGSVARVCESRRQGRSTRMPSSMLQPRLSTARETPTELYSVSNVTFCFQTVSPTGVRCRVQRCEQRRQDSTGKGGDRWGNRLRPSSMEQTPVGSFIHLRLPRVERTHSAAYPSVRHIPSVRTSLGTSWTRTVPVAATLGTVDCPDGTRGYSVSSHQAPCPAWASLASRAHRFKVESSTLTPTPMAHRTPVRGVLDAGRDRPQGIRVFQECYVRNRRCLHDHR